MTTKKQTEQIQYMTTVNELINKRVKSETFGYKIIIVVLLLILAMFGYFTYDSSLHLTHSAAKATEIEMNLNTKG